MDRKQLRFNIKWLEDIKAETTTPVMTYAKAVEAMGETNVWETTAMMVKYLDWDGRISQRNIDWANKAMRIFEPDPKVVENAYTSMHPAHLDQFADVVRRMAQY